ncbi:histidine phosphatase family protein [bacterium]|nr:histidine phosphatase family protein [bacterium]
MPLYLVRHGESTGNARGIYQGQQDYPLSETGIAQAQALGRWLASRRQVFSAVYGSPLSRAAQTAQIIAGATASPEVQLDPRLMEYASGRLEGLTAEDFKVHFPDFAYRGFDKWGDLSVYGGESLEQMEQRLHSFIEDLRARHDLASEHILAASHGGTLHHLIKLLVSHPRPRVMFTQLDNCTVVRLDEREVGGHRIMSIRWVLPLDLLGEQAGTDQNELPDER